MTETQRKKQVLYSYLDEEARTRRIKAQLHDLEERKTSISVNMDGMPHGTDVSDLSGYAARYDELERMYMRTIRESACKRLKISQAIEQVRDETERAVLTKRYIEGKTFEKIACELSYSWRQVCRIHGSALVHIDL